MKTVTKSLLGATCAALVWGCGGESNPNPDQDASVDSSTSDAGQPNETYPAQRVVSFSTNGADQLHAVAWAPDGAHFYASGLRDDTSSATGDRSTLVARFHRDGALDTTWGNGGSVVINVSGLGGRKVEIGRSIAVQTQGANAGKVVVGGVVEHDVDATGALANDADVFVLRLNANGALDMTFGSNGIRRLDLNDGVPNAAGTGVSGADQFWNISLWADDAILVHGSQRATGVWDADNDPMTPDVSRTDNDWAAVKLTAEGAVDVTWAATGATPGKFTFDAGYRESAGARTGVVLADGSVLGGGYATPTGAPQRPILFKLTPAGALDASWGSSGVFDQIDILSQAAEAYGAAPQGTSFVTAGYGRDTGDPGARWLSFRITSGGLIDETYGEMGALHHRFKSTVYGNGGNARSVVVLPDDSVLLLGGGAVSIPPTTLADGGAGPTTQTDGVAARLTADGALDTSFGTGGFLGFDLGGTSDFIAGTQYSVSPATTGTCSRRVALVGYRGWGNTQSDTQNDESGVVVLCLP